MEPFPSMDKPLLFNYGHVYHYALESLPALPSQERDEDDDVDNGLGHMRYKPFSAGCKYVNSAGICATLSLAIVTTSISLVDIICKLFFSFSIESL